jgi:cytochrome c oxidase subunit II
VSAARTPPKHRRGEPGRHAHTQSTSNPGADARNADRHPAIVHGSARLPPEVGRLGLLAWRVAASFTVVVLVEGLGGTQSAWAGIVTPESGGSSNADSIAGLYEIVLIIAAVIFCAVAGALVLFLVKYRARRGHVASQIRGNTRLEITWTAAAALILVVLAALTFAWLHGIVTPAASDDDAGAIFATVDQAPVPGGRALHVKVTGRQFVWRFDYPNGAYSYEKLVVPINTTVVLDIHSTDVNHSWWVPKLGGKFDAIPGYVNHTWFKITKPGIFAGQCAELCGQHHAEMIATVRAVPVAAWRIWAERQKVLIAQAGAADAIARARLSSHVGAGKFESP